MLEPRTPTARATAPTPGLAAPWRRLAAFCIDAVILTLVTGALWGRLLTTFAVWLGRSQSPGKVLGHIAADYLIVLGATICLAILYYWLLTGYWGTTFGKRALGIWVVRSDHSKASLRACLARAAVFVAGAEILALFFAADNLWLLGNPRRQTLHDKAAGTIVVRHPPLPHLTLRASSGRRR